MMFLLTCDKKLTKSQLSPTHASTKRKITDELKHNAGWYEVREGSPVEVQWAVGPHRTIARARLTPMPAVITSNDFTVINSQVNSFSG